MYHPSEGAGEAGTDPLRNIFHRWIVTAPISAPHFLSQARAV
jgi:hypothetical protein